MPATERSDTAPQAGSETPKARAVTSEIVEAAFRLAATLPPAFLCLLAINAVFLTALFWFEATEDAARMRVVGEMLLSCVKDRHG